MNGLKLWIARDLDDDLRLYFAGKPKRVIKNHQGWWNGKNQKQLDPKLFPEVTWENSPKQVELKLCNDGRSDKADS